MDTKRHKKTIWGSFALSMLLISLAILGQMLGIRWAGNTWFLGLTLTVPVIGIFGHSLANIGLKRSALFFALCFVIGLLFEIAGVKYGTAFGSHYRYAIGGIAIADVPVIVPLYWYVFIYNGYCLNNFFRFVQHRPLPSKANGDLTGLLRLVIADSLAVTAIDLMMDPVMVGLGKWSWDGGGAYFNIPWENFLGWFMVTAITMGVFRTYNFFRPVVSEPMEYLSPVLGFISIILIFTIYAVYFKIYALSALGLILIIWLVREIMLKYINQKNI